MTKPDEAVAAKRIDKTGAILSTVCALHCASSAVAPGLLAALGIGALAGPAAEWGFTAAAIIFATWALIIGWKRHRSLYVTFLFLAGIAGLGLGRCFEMLDIPGGSLLSIAAGAALVVAHVSGILLSRRNEATMKDIETIC